MEGEYFKRLADRDGELLGQNKVTQHLNGDIVEQSHSKGVNCSETFQPRGSSSVTKLLCA